MRPDHLSFPPPSPPNSHNLFYPSPIRHVQPLTSIANSLHVMEWHFNTGEGEGALGGGVDQGGEIKKNQTLREGVK